MGLFEHPAFERRDGSPLIFRSKGHYFVAPNMNTKNWARPISYLEPAFYDFLTWEARSLGVARDKLFDRYLREGIAKAKAEPESFQSLALPKAILLLCSPAMEPRLFEALRGAAFRANMPRNDALRRFLWLSMGQRVDAWLCSQALAQSAGAGHASKPARL